MIGKQRRIQNKGRCAIARIRYLKPAFWKDEDIAELPHHTRLFYLGLWNFADKSGRLKDRPKWLKVEIFPYEKADIEKMLQQLSKHKNNSLRPFIQRYEINGINYIQILAWDEHQKPHHQEQDSLLPPCPYNIDTIKTTETIKETITIKGMESVLGEPTPNPHRTNTEVSSIINDFNTIYTSNYKTNNKTTQLLINARLNEGFTVEDFKLVHRKMLKNWGADEKMCKYLRPQTLYSNKFESYLNFKEFTTKLTEKGVKSYLVGKAWLSSQVENENVK